MKLIDEVGGKEAVQAVLAEAVFRERKRLALTNELIDEACGFGPTASAGLPSIYHVEQDTRLMTSDFFSRASFLLQLNVDEVLGSIITKISEPTKDRILTEIASSPTVAAGVGADVAGLTPEDQFVVFAVLSLLGEMDEPPPQ